MCFVFLKTTVLLLAFNRTDNFSFFYFWKRIFRTLTFSPRFGSCFLTLVLGGCLLVCLILLWRGPFPLAMFLSFIESLLILSYTSTLVVSGTLFLWEYSLYKSFWISLSLYSALTLAFKKWKYLVFFCLFCGLEIFFSHMGVLVKTMTAST